MKAEGSRGILKNKGPENKIFSSVKNIFFLNKEKNTLEELHNTAFPQPNIHNVWETIQKSILKKKRQSIKCDCVMNQMFK